VRALRIPLLFALLAMSFGTQAQVEPDGGPLPRFSIGLRGALGLPTGSLAGGGWPRAEAGEFKPGRAAIGAGGGIQAEYWFSPSFSLWALADAIRLPGKAGYSGWHPLTCQHCAMIGSGPVSYTRTGEARGPWATESVLSGFMLRFAELEPDIFFKAGMGLRRVHTPHLVYRDAGTYRVTTTPQVQMVPYAHTLEIDAVTASAMAYMVGLEMRWPSRHRLHLVSAVEFHGCTPRIHSWYNSTLDLYGASDNMFWYSELKVLRSVNYLLLQFGVVYDLALRRTE